VVNAIEETPEHMPVASRFLELIWQSTCEGCGKEITSGYFEMALKFLVRLCPLCLKKNIVLLDTNDGGRIFRRLHYHGAHNLIQLSTNHTLTVSRSYCLKKKFKDINNKKHGGRLRSQLIYSLGHPFVAPKDSPRDGEWSGAIKPILLKWCNESYHIGNDVIVFTFMELSIVILQICCDTIDIALSASHIKDNTHLAEIRRNIRTTHFNVLFRQYVLKVKPESFMGNHQFNCFASSAIHQLDHFVPGSKLRFHAIDCGFMNNLYYHTSTTRNVYNYNNVRRWVKKTKLLD
jgi:hypothetical protein